MTNPRHASRSRLATAGLALMLAGCGADAIPAASPTNIDIVAVNVAFEPTTLVLPAQTPVHVTFENRDFGVPHGIAVALRTSGVESPELGRSETIVGVARAGFDIVPLAPGAYLFSCPVHPNMQIEVEVG
jgi:plastocyanin